MDRVQRSVLSVIFSPEMFFVTCIVINNYNNNTMKICFFNILQYIFYTFTCFRQRKLHIDVFPMNKHSSV